MTTAEWGRSGSLCAGAAAAGAARWEMPGTVTAGRAVTAGPVSVPAGAALPSTTYQHRQTPTPAQNGQPSALFAALVSGERA